MSIWPITATEVKPFGQRLAIEVFHHQEVDAVLTPDIVQRANVRMAQRGDGAGFAVEALAELRVAGGVREQDFDRDGAFQAGVASFVNFPHSASATGQLDLVRAEPRANRKDHL